MPPLRSSSRLRLLARVRRAPEDHPAGHADEQDAVEHAHQADVQPHVAVEDVAELVRDHALELVARQVADAAAGDADDRVARRVAGGEGVDPVLLVHQVDRRHGRARGDRHLLDDVEDLPLVGVGRLRRERPAAEHLGDGVPAARQRGDPVQAAAADQQQRPRRHDAEQGRVPEDVARGRRGPRSPRRRGSRRRRRTSSRTISTTAAAK